MARGVNSRFAKRGQSLGASKTTRARTKGTSGTVDGHRKRNAPITHYQSEGTPSEDTAGFRALSVSDPGLD